MKFEDIIKFLLSIISTIVLSTTILLLLIMGTVYKNYPSVMLGGFYIGVISYFFTLNFMKKEFWRKK